MRAVFILVGAELVLRFAFAFVIFGLFLIYTAVKLVREHGREPQDVQKSLAVPIGAQVRRRAPGRRRPAK